MPTDITAAADQLREAMARKQLAQIQREIAVLNREQHVADLESRYVEAEIKVVDPRAYLYDTPGFGFMRGTSEPVQPFDTFDGHNFPFWASESEWRMIHGAARHLETTDETTINILEQLASYVIAGGCQYQVNASHERYEKKAAGLIRAVQQVVDDFLSRNEWIGNRDRLAYKRYRARGEQAARIVRDERNRPRVEFLPLGQIIEPDIQAQKMLNEYYDLFGHWSYGVCTEGGPRGRFLGLYLQTGRGPNDWEFVPADEVVYLRRNVDEGVKRGLTDLYASNDRLKRADKVFTNTLSGAAIQSSIGLIRRHDPNKPGPYKSLGSSTKITFEDDDGDEQTIELEPTNPGRIVDVKGYDVQPGPMGDNNSEDYLKVGQCGQTVGGLRWALPEYMSTGVSDDVNHAASLTAESPFLRARQADQTEHEANERALLWQLVRDSCRPGGELHRRFRGISYERVRRYVRINVETPDTSVRDENAKTERLERLHAAGQLSGRTWAAMEGLDYEQEQERLAEERAAQPEPSLADAAKRARESWRGYHR